MKVHRIALRNFRGVEHSEVEFAEVGVTVVCGPNEVGKSSLPEALGLIRQFKSSSKHRDISAVQPTHRDEGPRVEVEITTGAYRFIYAKQWLRSHGTTLTVTEPSHEQLTGDEAHERAEQIFDQTVDQQLWTALAQVQGQSLDQPTLADVAPLHRALDQADDGSSTAGAHDDLLSAIRAQRELYWTAADDPRPRQTLKRFAEELESAQEQVRQAEKELRDAQDLVDRHLHLQGDLEVVTRHLTESRDTVDGLSVRVAELTEVQQRAKSARAAHESAVEGVRRAAERLRSRTAAAEELTARETSLARAERLLQEVTAQLRGLEQELGEAQDRERSAEDALIAAREARQAAEAGARARQARAELADIDSTLR